MTVLTDITERPVLLLGWTVAQTASPSGIAGSESVGTPRANAAVAATGIGEADALGTAATTAIVVANGINVGTGSIGTPSAVTSIYPAGISATGGGLGTPSVAMVMSPVGIASTGAFGDVSILAIVLILPNSVGPGGVLGTVTATKKGWIFRPPVNTYKWRLFKEYEGISLLKENGVWSEVAHPDLPRTKSAEKYLAGGRDHVVGDALKAELEGLGYTVTDEVVTTEEYL